MVEDGGSPILSYSLEMDDDTGFVSVSGELSDDLTTLRVVTLVNSGQTYTFRYRARNIYGWGDYSESTAIVTSSVPTPPLNIVTSNSEIATTVTISWDAPVNFGGDGILIDSYLISV